jgi:hypothetical protein
MAPLIDPRLLATFLGALKEWNCAGVIQWKPLASEWVRKNLDGCTPKGVGRLMYEYVNSGGEIDQVVETREDYRNRYPYHYDFRIPIAGRLIYVETCFDETDRMGPIVFVVNIHYA